MMASKTIFNVRALLKTSSKTSFSQKSVVSRNQGNRHRCITGQRLISSCSSRAIGLHVPSCQSLGQHAAVPKPSSIANRKRLPNFQRYCTASTNGDHHTPEDLNSTGVKSQDFATLKTMQKTLEEHHMFLLKDSDQPEDAQCLKVAVIGAPNSGKSTLTNALLGWRVSSVSSKVHTTRSRVNAVLTEDNTQLIFLDTPGMIHPSKRKRHKLDHSLIRDPYSSLYQADIIAVIVDISVPWVSAGLDKEVLKALTLHEDKHSILVLNKVDLLKSKQKLLHLTRLLTQGVIDGKKDSFVKKATSKRRVKELLEIEETKELLKKHLPQNQKTLDNEDRDMSALNSDDSRGDVAPAEEGVETGDIWNAGGVFTGKKVVFAMPEKRMRKDMMPLADLRTWEEYSKALSKAHESVKDRQGWDQFKQVFMVSSTEQDGVEDLKDYLLDQAVPGDWLYHSSVVTDQLPVDMIKHCIWEKLLDHLPNDVPYNLEVELEMLLDEGSIFRIAANVLCPSLRHLRLTMGRGGKTIALIASEAKQSLMNTFKCDISLLLVAKPQWLQTKEHSLAIRNRIKELSDKRK